MALKNDHHLIAHHGACHSEAKIIMLHRAGFDTHESSHFAELRLNTPFYLVDNDVMILRDAGNQQVIAGARVMLLDPPKRGKNTPTFLEGLDQKNAAQNDLETLRVLQNRGAVFLSTFAWARQLTPSALDEIIALLPDTIRAGDILTTQTLVEALSEKCQQSLRLFHERFPESPGVGRERLHRMSLLNEPQGLYNLVLDRCLNNGCIVHTKGWLHLPEHRLTFTERETLLWQKALPLFDAAPCWVRDVATTLSVSEADVRALFFKASKMSQIAAVVRDRYYLMSQLQSFADLIRKEGKIDAATLRNLLGIGRKLAIQILEFFDRTGFTLRRGDQHCLRDAELFIKDEDPNPHELP
jgi:selenocysteine-specific elongation factor